MSAPGRRDRREDYISPVGAAREPRPVWREVWPFRLVAIAALLVVLLLVYLLIDVVHLTGGGNAQG